MSMGSTLFMGFSFTDEKGTTKQYEPTCAHFGFRISPAISCAYTALAVETHKFVFNDDSVDNLHVHVDDYGGTEDYEKACLQMIRTLKINTFLGIPIKLFEYPDDI